MNTLYYCKKTNNNQDWKNVLDRLAWDVSRLAGVKRLNFSLYNFMIDGEVFEEQTDKFDKKLSELQIWLKLSNCE